MAWRAISRRSGSKLERMIAPGVSSTMSSTPVASSRARMLRPSRPMMRPFMSSLGRSTTDTVVSMACSAALRWIASVMICLARAAAISRASVSSRLTRCAASRRASLSTWRMSRSLASSAVSPRQPLQFALLIIGQALVASCGFVGGLRAQRHRLVARAQVLLVAIDSSGSIGDCTRLVGERLLEARQLLAPLARLPLDVDQHLVGALLARQDGLFQPRLRFALGVAADALGLFLGAADGLRRQAARGWPSSTGRPRLRPGARAPRRRHTRSRGHASEVSGAQCTSRQQGRNRGQRGEARGEGAGSREQGAGNKEQGTRNKEQGREEGGTEERRTEGTRKRRGSGGRGRGAGGGGRGAGGAPGEPGAGDASGCALARETKEPRVAVWGGRMNLRLQVEPLLTAARQASSEQRHAHSTASQFAWE